MTVAPVPSRGEIWLADLNPTRGHEQSGRHPCVVVSTNFFNHGPSGLIIILPLTTHDRGVPLHILIEPPDGGARHRSFIKSEDVRSIAIERLVERWGTVSRSAMDDVEDRLRVLLEL